MTGKNKPKKSNGNHLSKLLPLTDNQGHFQDSITGCKVTIGSGPAGTGKTYVALHKAAEMYSKGFVDKIIITRPALGVDEDTGYLPGSLEDKFGPWSMPILNTLKHHMGEVAFNEATKRKDIMLMPLQYMRGYTFINSFIFMDEAQNTTMRQMKMFLTRIGEGSKVVIVGDPEQSDLRQMQHSGTELALEFITRIVKDKNYDTRDAVCFTSDDIVRDEECAFWSDEFKQIKVF